MDISETHLSGIGYDIRLPHFGDVLPDRFYSRMAEEMIGYVSKDRSVRRYSSFFCISEKEGEIMVTVEIHARLCNSVGSISRHKKTLFQIWKDGMLISFSREQSS